MTKKLLTSADILHCAITSEKIAANVVTAAKIEAQMTKQEQIDLLESTFHDCINPDGSVAYARLDCEDGGDGESEVIEKIRTVIEALKKEQE